jgi:hypothetical protein
MRTVIIDTIQVFLQMHESEKADICRDFLGALVFENNDIIKIFHGALGGDIGWL